MEELKSSLHLIREAIKERSVVKQDVYSNTKSVFHQFRECLEAIVSELAEEVEKIDTRVEIRLHEESEYEIHLKFGGDLLLFTMHTNVFNFEETHSIHQTEYVKADPSRSYCGMINFHNFLADSYKYNRGNDLGFLIARVFVNKENHFFVEGHRQLGFLYNDFEHAVLNKVYVRAIIESAILFSLEFELTAPPFEAIKEISVHEMRVLSQQAGLITTKRPGYKFYTEESNLPKAKKKSDEPKK